MTPEVNSSKPEWFQIAESDAAAAQVRKVNKKLPAIALVVTGAIIATGAIFANASEEQSASAQVGQTQVATTPVATISGATTHTIASGTTSVSSTAAPHVSSTSLAPGSIQNPKVDGSVAPQRGDDAEEDDSRDGDDERD